MAAGDSGSCGTSLNAFEISARRSEALSSAGVAFAVGIVGVEDCVLGVWFVAALLGATAGCSAVDRCDSVLTSDGDQSGVS